jgi:8-oxo-dGTP diphosphatase
LSITKVGIGVAIIDGSDVLLGKRKGSHGAGEWALPGGHLDYMESFEDCARREIAEEMGDEVTYGPLKVVSLINLTDYAPKHYIDIGMVTEYVSGTPLIMEPDKCDGWHWVPIDDILWGRTKYKTFATVARILDAHVVSKQFEVYDVPKF